MQKEKTIYALGFFDGVHLGHQALLTACKELAAEHGCNVGALTFTSHPDALTTGNAPALINSIEDREQLLFGYGAEIVWQLPFNEEVKNTHWSSFLTQLLESDAAGFVCGSDFRFGAGGLGTAKKLAAFCEKRGLPYAVVPQQTFKGIRVSSTHIRQILEDGDTLNAESFLGHPHILTGRVVAGQGLGHTIGIPTANVEVPEGVLLPKQGVYACGVVVGEETYTALTNIGSRPTVNGQHVTMESWLMDFDGDLYGKTITVVFIADLRPEEKFNSLEELKTQIEKDAAQIRKILEKS